MKTDILSCGGQFLKYGIAGGVGVLIDFLVYSILVTFFQIQYLLSNVFSFCLGTIIVCYMQKNWTFQYTSNKRLQLYSKYMLSIGLVFTINTLLLIGGIEFMQLTEINAKIIQVFLSTFIGYFIQKNFVFTNQNETDEE